ncbi:MAG: NADH-ubiquinone oxidoreductase-F iron-sulfur binding region domain-containing protein [Acidobacteriota bacterium]|nr:NADH-ubiquinone oxidoreductase-F iron-sulfur binding region domain-containing protein [Acidobacteriota bacterium]
MRLAHPGHLADWRTRLREEAPAFERTIVVTAGTCGRASGAMPLIEALRSEIDGQGFIGRIGLLITGCHGYCEAEPSLVVQPEGYFYGRLKPSDAAEIVAAAGTRGRFVERLGYKRKPGARPVRRLADLPFYRKQHRRLTEAHLGLDPERIEDYVLRGGYGALAKALFEMTASAVIEAVEASGLRGRGGAGFPTGFKWRIVRNAAGHPKHVVGNADEGDPGAYMDRGLLEGNPHAILEGMIIGAYAVGASEGCLYVRAEYPLAVANIRRAVDQARDCGLLGENILGSEFHFDVRVAQGAGAFVSGEETALIASIEGRRPHPRPRPPYPSESGLGGRPTVINNVETWANIAPIIDRGPDWFASVGAKRSRGTKIFSLVGRVRRTGLVEVPMGVSLRDIIEDIGGGALPGHTLKAVQTGGPSGGCLPAASLDVKVDYEDLARAGSIMGSGGLIVLDDRACMVDVARYFVGFAAEESCGKCAPCRIGTRRLRDMLDRIVAGLAEPADLDRLESLARTVQAASLCGLGRTAVNPVLSTLRYFCAEYKAHIEDRSCPAGVCRDLLSYAIDPGLCTGCGLCRKACPAGAITGRPRSPHAVSGERCVKCGACADACPPDVKAVRIGRAADGSPGPRRGRRRP